eukprot:6199094-Pleurochrysis_carterae.AAC.1
MCRSRFGRLSLRAWIHVVYNTVYHKVLRARKDAGIACLPTAERPAQARLLPARCGSPAGRANMPPPSGPSHAAETSLEYESDDVSTAAIACTSGLRSDQPGGAMAVDQAATQSSSKHLDRHMLSESKRESMPVEDCFVDDDDDTVIFLDGEHLHVTSTASKVSGAVDSEEIQAHNQEEVSKAEAASGAAISAIGSKHINITIAHELQASESSQGAQYEVGSSAAAEPQGPPSTVAENVSLGIFAAS